MKFNGINRKTSFGENGIIRYIIFPKKIMVTFGLVVIAC